MFDVPDQMSVSWNVTALTDILYHGGGPVPYLVAPLELVVALPLSSVAVAERGLGSQREYNITTWASNQVTQFGLTFPVRRFVVFSMLFGLMDIATGDTTDGGKVSCSIDIRQFVYLDANGFPLPLA